MKACNCNIHSWKSDLLTGPIWLSGRVYISGGISKSADLPICFMSLAGSNKSNNEHPHLTERRTLRLKPVTLKIQSASISINQPYRDHDAAKKLGTYIHHEPTSLGIPEATVFRTAKLRISRRFSLVLDPHGSWSYSPNLYSIGCKEVWSLSHSECCVFVQTSSK